MPAWKWQTRFPGTNQGDLALFALEKQTKGGDVGANGGAVCSRDPITYARSTAIIACGEGEGRW